MKDRAFASASRTFTRVRLLLAALGGTFALYGSQSSLAHGSGHPVVWSAVGGAPIPPSGLPPLTAVDAGDYHVVGLAGDGSVVGWGLDNFGQASVPAGLTAVVRVSAGRWHSAALRADGTVVCWGLADHGATSVPTGLGGVVDVSAGGFFTSAAKSDGSVRTWGAASVSSATPIGAIGATAVAAGHMHCLALRASGTVVAWGIDYQGEGSVPSGLDDVVAIAAGTSSSIALRSTGEIVCWGEPQVFGFCPTNVAGATAIAVNGLNAVAVHAGGALTIACEPGNPYPLCTPPKSLGTVSAVSLGERFAVALVVDQPCPADLDADGAVGAPDVAAVLAAWGPHPKGHAADLSGDGQVSAPDIAMLLAAWGSCP